MGEPVGWIYEDDEGRMMFSQMPHPDPLWEPVYRAAPQRQQRTYTLRKWVGLTDEDIWELAQKTPDFRETVAATEAKLKAKNT